MEPPPKYPQHNRYQTRIEMNNQSSTIQDTAATNQIIIEHKKLMEKYLQVQRIASECGLNRRIGIQYPVIITSGNN